MKKNLRFLADFQNFIVVYPLKGGLIKSFTTGAAWGAGTPSAPKYLKIFLHFWLGNRENPLVGGVSLNLPEFMLLISCSVVIDHFYSSVLKQCYLAIYKR